MLEESLRNKIESMANFSTNITRKKRELENIMKRYDTDGWGFIIPEFRAALSQLNSHRDGMFFRAYDADGNKAELRRIQYLLLEEKLEGQSRLPRPT